MDRVFSNKIEVVLLYDQFAVISPNIWTNLINEFSAKHGVAFESTPNVKVPDFFHFLSKSLTIEVDYVTEPVVKGAFENSLASEYTKRIFPDANDMLDRHNSYVHIVITNGLIDPPNPFIEDQAENPQIIFDAESFDFAAELLRWLSIVQISSGQPLGVYWAQCDKLLPCREFLKSAIDFKDLALLVHPMFTSQIDDETGNELHGLRTLGVNSLIGCEIKIEPLPVPPEELVACVEHLIGITSLTGLMVPENHVFGRSDGEEIRVHQRLEDGVPLIELEFERFDAFGITKTISEDVDDLNNFDMDDPAERAMYEKIQKVRDAEALLQLEESQDSEVSSFTEELSGNDTWDGVKKKVDMASLRNLARTTESEVVVEPEPEEDKPAEKAPRQKRLLKKVGGLFSRN